MERCVLKTRRAEHSEFSRRRGVRVNWGSFLVICSLGEGGKKTEKKKPKKKPSNKTKRAHVRENDGK